MDIGEQEARRADNQIWNAAGAYGFATGSRGYEPNGEASLYFNTAIGLVRRLYDYRKLEILLTALERRSSGEMQSELLWLGLERCAYLKYRDSRPALTFLRRDYAQRQLQQDFSVNSEQDRLKIGWFRRALGLPSEESDREKQILDALEFDPDWDAEAIQSRMERILYKYFGRNLRSEMDHLGTSRVDLGFFAKLILRPGGLNRLGQAAPEGGVGLRALSRRIFGWREARKDDLRQYAAACFGKSMLTPAELADAERVCCTGRHRGCVLHFTRGEAPENGEAPTREWEQLQEQAERNRAYFRAHLAQNRLEIQRLAQQLQNTILLLQEDGSLRCRAGRVDPALAWRAPSLGDGRVFARQQPNTLGNLIVDILLDASASQNRRQEQLATQGYILAEGAVLLLRQRLHGAAGVPGLPGKSGQRPDICVCRRRVEPGRPCPAGSGLASAPVGGAAAAFAGSHRREPQRRHPSPRHGKSGFQPGLQRQARRGRRRRGSDGSAQTRQSAAVPVLRPGGRFEQRPHHLRPGCGQAALRGLVCPDCGEDHSGTLAGAGKLMKNAA